MKALNKPLAGYLTAVAAIAAVTAVCFPLHQHFTDTTVALAMVVVVLFVATAWGSLPALAASIAGMLCFNYFFLPPTLTLTIADPENWIALAAFFITALTAGSLSARAKQRAAALAAERTRLLDVLDLLPAYVILLTPDYHVAFANRFFRERFGESHGRPCFEYLFGRDRPCEVCETYKVLKTGAPLCWEWTGPDNRQYDISDFLFIESDGSACILEMGIDITERKRAEEAVRESEANLNRAQEIANIGSWRLDIPRNRLTWSAEVFRMFDLPGGTPLTYQAFIDMVYPEDRGRVEEAWQAALAGGPPYDIEHRILVGGQLRWVRERAEVEFDQQGKPYGGIGTVQDITARKRAEAEIRRISRTNRALSRCNETLIRATDESTLLQQVCNVVVEEAGYRLCWVGRAEQDELQSVKPIAQAGLEDGYLGTLGLTWKDTERGQGPTGTCIRTRQIVVAKSFATDPNLALWRDEALKRGYASSVAIPLLIDSGVYGALMIYASEPDAFGAEEVKLLTELANDLAFGITALRTKAERARAEAEIRTLNAGLEQRVTDRTAELQAANAALERAREREFEIGFRIQQILLLDLPPADIPGLQIAALSLPSQRIDGDFYAFFKYQNQSLDVIVGDVMGKGIPAALLGAATKSQLLMALSQRLAVCPIGTLPEPNEIVMQAHSEIARQLMDLDSFVTLCYARLDMKSRQLRLVDCGHTGTIHWHARTGICEVLHGDNLPLGVRADEVYSEITIPFEAGDLFFFYSDGITEARNAAGELFGVERLQECVRDAGEQEPEMLIETVRRAVALFSGSSQLADDLTSVAVRATAHAEIEIRSDPGELRRMREFVREFCHDAPGSPLEPDSVSALELAVHEAAVNIMKHAYHGRADEPIHLDGDAFPGHVSIQLHHLGDSFDPAAVPPPAFDGSRESGFGTYMISRSVDEVRYYRDERGGCCVELVKSHKS